jgi:hypothetical protein
VVITRRGGGPDEHEMEGGGGEGGGGEGGEETEWAQRHWGAFGEEAPQRAEVKGKEAEREKEREWTGR